MQASRSRIFIHSYLSIFLVFGWSLVTSVLPANGLVDHSAALTTYQNQLTANQSTLSTYTDTFTTYAPEDLAQLDDANTAVNSLSTFIDSYAQAISNNAAATDTLGTTQLAIDVYPQLLQNVTDDLPIKQSAYDQASSDAIAADSSDYRTALQNRDDAQTAFEADPSEENASALSSAEDTLAPLATELLSAQQDLQNAANALGEIQGLYDLISPDSWLQGLEEQRDQDQLVLDGAAADLSTAYSNVVQAGQDSQAALDSVVLPATSLVVSSLADDGSDNTLRWAITQANANSGTIYDKITFEVTGTITLTSNLPAITQNLTVEGPGEANLTIDGQYLYSGFYVANRVLTISGLTFTEMYNSNWQYGAALYAVRGTIYASAITVDTSTTAIATKEGGTTIYLTDSTLYNNVRGLFSNYGGTPTTPSADDSIYDNKIFSSRVIFDSNNIAIYGERTMLVDDSTFIDNGTGFLMRGLNKHRVTNSTFDGNGTAINIGSWWPAFTGYLSAPHLNAVITGNTFTSNALAIRMGAYYNNMLTQVGANVSDNIWDEAGTFIISYEADATFTDTVTPREGAEYYSSNNTNLPRTIAAPTNVVVVQNEDNSITITWNASAVLNTTVERYAIFFFAGSSGWAVTSLTTSATLSPELFEGTGGLDTSYDFKIRGDNDSEAIYSPFSIPTSFLVASPVVEPAPTSSPEPTGPSQSVQVPEEESSPEATPTPTKEPEKEPAAAPAPTQSAVAEPDPTPSSTPTPTPSPSKTSAPEPTASATPTPTKTAEPAPTSTSTPTTQPTAQATSTPTTAPTQTPTATPTKPTSTSTPSSTPSSTPTKQDTPVIKEVVEIKEPITAENIEAVVEEITKIEEPRDITTEQRTVLTAATNQVFAQSPRNSVEYTAALEVLTVLAQADDPEIPEELAAIPLVGAAASAVLEVFNSAGNAGADMSPVVREESEKVVVASVVVATAATAAATAATAATAASAASSSGGGSVSGSGSGARTIRKIKY